jgi:hypothetical protein
MVCLGVTSAAYNLELNRDDSEVQGLNQGPYKEIRLESWDVNVLEFTNDSALATALGDGHKREKAGKT